MIKKNIYQIKKEMKVAHNGTGSISFSRSFFKNDFQSNLSFIDYVEVPPGASIGFHRHGNNEEIYFIIEGQGIMTTNDDKYSVSSGDLILNRPGWSHGFENTTLELTKILVWEVGI